MELARFRREAFATLFAITALGCAAEETGAETVMDASVPGRQPSDASTHAQHAADADQAVADSGTSTELIEFDRSGYTDVGLEPLDYAEPAMWACRPDAIPNACDGSLDATLVEPDGGFVFEAHEAAAAPGFDCFYVYPTVNVGGVGNETNFADISPVSPALLSQAARFNRLCRVFAPLYRQSASGAMGGGPELELAKQDVRDAFAHYMSAHNAGRDIVLMGHSQGTHMLTTLAQETFDVDESLRAQLLSALLIGGDVTVPQGDVVGGTFQNIPACTTAGQRGCVVAYSSFVAESPPGGNARFGRADAGMQTVCTNPSLLAGADGLLDSILPSGPGTSPLSAPGQLPTEVDQPWGRYPDMFRAECINSGGLSYLQISVAGLAGDVRQPPPYRNTLAELTGFGLHVVDYNLSMGSLVELVRLQAQ